MTLTASSLSFTPEALERALWLFACCASALAALAAKTEARACMMLSLFWAALVPCLLTAGAEEAAIFAAVIAAAGWALTHLQDAPPSEPPAPLPARTLSERTLHGLLPCLASALAAGGLTAMLTAAPPASSPPSAPAEMADVLYESAADFFTRRPQDALALLCLTTVTLLGASVPSDQPKGNSEQA